MPGSDAPIPPPDAPGDSPRSAISLASRLAGTIPCIACRYDLRGLSVRDVCPECGTAVRATILAVVDPYAQVLRPIRRPRVVSAAVVMWTGGAVAGAILAWGVRASSLVGLPLWEWRLAVAEAMALAISALAAFAIVTPHAGLPGARRLVAAIGCVAMAGLPVGVWNVYLSARNGADPYLDVDRVEPSHALWRIAVGVLAIVALVCLRPNARLLASRSMLVRLGQVDRQTMRSIAFVVGVGLLGDSIRLVAVELSSSRLAWSLNLLGLTLIVVSSFLWTVGLVEMFRDALRIAPVLRRPAVGLSDLVEKDEGSA